MMSLSVSFKGFIIISIDLNESMGMRSQDWNIKELASPDIAGAISSANHRSPGPPNSSIHFLSPARTELHQWLIFDNRADTGCLSGNQGLKINDIEQGSLNQLTLSQWTFHLHDWLIGKNQITFLNRSYCQAHLEISQIIQKLSVIAQGLQII